MFAKTLLLAFICGQWWFSCLVISQSSGTYHKTEVYKSQWTEATKADPVSLKWFKMQHLLRNATELKIKCKLDISGNDATDVRNHLPVERREQLWRLPLGR